VEHYARLSFRVLRALPQALRLIWQSRSAA
jgi:hypothetical protein